MSQEQKKPDTSIKELPTPAKDSQVEIYRIKKAFWLAVFGLLLAAILVIVLLAFDIKTSNDIVAIVGLFTSVLGTLVGAFFGLQIGSAGKEKVEERADKAEQKSSAILGAASPDIIENAKRLFPEAFK
jgi:hypothetical protein